MKRRPPPGTYTRKVELALLSLIMLGLGCWIVDHFAGFVAQMVGTALPIWGGFIMARKVIVPLIDESRAR